MPQVSAIGSGEENAPVFSVRLAAYARFPFTWWEGEGAGLSASYRGVET
jgi:hypothetical protein